MTRGLLLSLCMAPAAVAQPLTGFASANNQPGLDRLFRHTFNADAGRTVTPLPAGGYRFVVPAGKYGLLLKKADVVIPGPVQVEATVELEAVPDAVPANGGGLSVGFFLDGRPETDGGTSVNRGVYPGVGHQYRASRNVPRVVGQGGHDYHFASADAPATGRKNRVAVRRVGREVVHLAADDPAGEFREVFRYKFTDQPLLGIGLFANGGGAAVTATVTDIVIRTGADVPTAAPEPVANARVVSALPDRPTAADPDPEPAPAAATPTPVVGRWWLPVLSFAVGLAAGVLAGRATASRSLPPTKEGNA